MASIRVPSNVSSVTLVTSGVLTPTAGVITGMTATELTDLVSPYSWGPKYWSARDASTCLDYFHHNKWSS